jgi:CubicO group peptidase (beta-lactamase class C family)
MRRRPAALLLLCLAALPGVPGWARAEPPPDAPLAAAVDALVRKNGFTAEGPGLAVLVYQPGKFVLKKGYGLADLDGQTPVTPRTLFELASVSKTFTATAVLILHDRGKLSVDDDVRRYLPELPEYRKGRLIRIRDLLQHVSGVPDYLEFEDVPARHKGYRVNEDYAGEFARQRRKFPLHFAPGERYEYSNTNFMLLALIVERVSGESFGTFLHDEVFVPAGMTDSFVYESPEAVPAHPAPGCVNAVGYEKAKKKGRWTAAWGTPPSRHEELLTVGDGAVWTNLEDMTRWDAAVRGGKLVKPETMRLALTPSKTRDGKTNNYGFGWALYFDDGGKLIGYGHDGSWGGFHTSYYRYVAADRTTVLLSNRGDFDPDKFWYALDDVVEKALAKKK